MKWLASFFASAIVVLGARTARAEAPDAPPPTRSYGYAIAASDGASALLIGVGAVTFAAGARSKSDAGAWAARIGVLGYGLGAPIIHWAHGHAAKGLLSLGMRAAIPALTLGSYGAAYGLGDATRGGVCVGRSDDSENECERTPSRSRPARPRSPSSAYR